MRIDSQKAQRDIYNITGDVKLEASEEVVKKLEEAKQTRLKELNNISFLDVLTNHYAKKKLIERKHEIDALKKSLFNHQQIIVNGEPGLGKTTLLYQFASSSVKAIYISLKDRSALSILSRLINKIRLENKESLFEIEDIDQGLEWLEVSLQKTESIFIIDDCEQNIALAKSLMALEKFKTKFIFGTRNESVFEESGVESYAISIFDENEVRLFLALHNISLETLPFNDLLRACQGNPLYLFYYAHFQVNSLPEGLANYQSSIWSSLDEDLKEILTYITISYYEISTVELAGISGLDSPMKLTKALGVMSPLVRNSKGKLQIFHPSFKDFILQRLEDEGTRAFYHRKLGEFFISKEDIIQATYLLIDFAPELVDVYLFDIFPYFMKSGELQFSKKVIDRALKTEESKLHIGYLHYHKSQVCYLMGDIEGAGVEIDDAIKNIEKTESPLFFFSARMFKAMNLVDKGNVQEALKIADTVFAELPTDNDELKAPLLVNLSKIYVDLSEYRKGAKTSKDAYEIFSRNEDTEGMTSSLVNLTSCLAQMDDSKDLAIKYGLLLLDTPNIDVRIEVIACNALASVFREQKEFDEAKKYSQRAIKLCQTYGMKDKAVMNLINFGNIVRDEGQMAQARKIYDEALMLTQEHKLKKDEGRIYWIFADMEIKEGQFSDGLNYAAKSISCSKELNYYYGIANASRAKGEAHLGLNQPIEAAKSFEQSAEYFAKMEQFSDSYQHKMSRAIRIYLAEGMNAEAQVLLIKLISTTKQKLEFNQTTELILEDTSDPNRVLLNFKALLKSYYNSKDDESNMLLALLTFMDYCRNLEDAMGKSNFNQILEILIERIGNRPFSFSLLGIAIEQSGELLNKDSIGAILQRLQGLLPMFSCREINDELVIITSIENKINLEIHVFHDEVICQKLALALILLLHEAPQLIIDDDTPFLERKCELWIPLFGEEMRKALGEYIMAQGNSFANDVQTIHTEKKEYDFKETAIVNPEYEKHAVITSNPDNKTSLYFSTMTIMGIKSHFYHSDIKNDDAERKSITNSIAWLYNYPITDVIMEKVRAEFKVDIDFL